ncbi:PHB depolymerase family esterase [Kitasatospora sp. CB02891]|uniref:extracellular catalytic domain type 1 short-chain-length polyhydroxyalkanoate depolymerase n=1 Tax=Kitasatospora sp. CB02891 TaxID=2020329 RepID=UPI000C2747D8|nr:esterase [Kitasatospora sp. CB02891]
MARHTSRAGRIGRWATALVAGAVLTAGMLTGAPQASAAGLGQVTGFGSNPGNLAMYSYVPSGLATGKPLVVALHGCVQSATDYYNNSGWAQLADRWGFAVVFPQTGATNNALSCFSWFDSSKDTRGRGEALSVKQMVDKAVALYGSDPSRVYVTGLSAGAGMAADLLADYPDVFAGGSIASGLPAQCATAQSAAAGCQNSDQNLTPAQWGDKVRASNPGWTGPWPRVAIWHGSSDTTVAPVNATELRDQWTNVWGIPQTASSTRSLPGSTTLSVYNDSAGRPAVQLYSVSGMGHGLPVSPGSGTANCGQAGAYFLNTVCSSYWTGLFWGLDGSGGDNGGGTQLPAPGGLAVTGTTDTTVSLSWSAVAGAASYTVYRGGAQVGAATGTAYTDSGLGAGTGYTYTVAAVDANGTVGKASSAVTATTTGSVFTPKCWTDNNYNQVAAGRAHQSGGYAYANGSNQNMGLWNLFVVRTLKETSAGFFVLADSGCAA